MTTFDLTHLPTTDHERFGDLMLDLGDRQTMMLWGPPGLGKTETATRFAEDNGYHFFNLVAPMMDATDLLVPRFMPDTNTTVRCPPHELIHHPQEGEAQKPSFVLLDELNAAEISTVKALFSLINERRLGNVVLPKNSVVLAIGNPPETNSGARPLLAPIMNRMLHLHFKLQGTRGWLDWFGQHQDEQRFEPLIADYIRDSGLARLTGRPGNDGQISTSPRSWAALARALSAPGLGWPDARKRAALALDQSAAVRAAGDLLRTIATGCVSADDAIHLATWYGRQARSLALDPILRGETALPLGPDDRLLLLGVMAQLRARLVGELPELESGLKSGGHTLKDRALYLLRQVQQSQPEVMEAVLGQNDDGRLLPGWFLDELLGAELSRSN